MSMPIFHMVSGPLHPVTRYRHGVEIAGRLFVTKHIATDLAYNPTTIPESIKVQAHKIMQNLRTILQGVGARLENVFCARVFLTHFDEGYDSMNRVCAGYFTQHERLARTCVELTALAGGARVMIDLIARRP